MSNIVIKVENVSKLYRLGEVGTGTIAQDLNRWWAKVRGKEDPFAKIGETNDRTKKGESNYVWSLKDIDFEIKQGDAVGIIGRNGAGKSTLLKLLSKVTAPTNGRIKVKGRIASLLEVGTGFHPELTGRENIFLNGAILGMRREEIRRKFDEIVDFSGVERYIDTPVKRYSSGMYVRLAFAVAAHLESEILIVDEVLAVGDAEFQKKCLGKMGDVSKGEGRTVLFVSHNMSAVENLCNRGLYMKNGIIVSTGGINNIIDYYINDSKQRLNIPVAERQDRIGNNTFRFEKIIIGNSDFSKTYQTIKTGQAIVIRIYFKIKPERLKNVQIDIGINNERDIRVSWLSTNLSIAGSLNLIKDKDYIDFILPTVQLVPGDYNITLYALSNGEVADWLANAYSFVVEQGDFFNTGKFPPPTQGFFLTHHSIKY